MKLKMTPQITGSFFYLLFLMKASSLDFIRAAVFFFRIFFCAALSIALIAFFASSSASFAFFAIADFLADLSNFSIPIFTFRFLSVLFLACLKALNAACLIGIDYIADSRGRRADERGHKRGLTQKISA